MKCGPGNAKMFLRIARQDENSGFVFTSSGVDGIKFASGYAKFRMDRGKSVLTG
jgi:hypothetical protein